MFIHTFSLYMGGVERVNCACMRYSVKSQSTIYYVTRYEKKGQLTEKHILQDRRKCLPAHTKALFALLRLITTNPSNSLQA